MGASVASLHRASDAERQYRWTDQMRWMLWIAGALGGAMLATWKIVVTIRLWRSPMYDRRQRIAQTAIVWLVPGMAFFVNWLLIGMPGRSSPLDPSSNDGATDYGKQGVGINANGPF
jgi:hypothetical protein